MNFSTGSTFYDGVITAIIIGIIYLLVHIWVEYMDAKYKKKALEMKTR